MRFLPYGRTYQLCIESAADLETLLGMDETLWVATSAPVSAFRCDAKFLALVDADGNGRISSNELKEAIRWLLPRLADTTRLGAEADSLPLAAIRSDTPDGQALLASARYLLTSIAAGEQETIALSQVRNFLATIQSRPLNGDGVLVPAAANDPVMAAFLKDAVACTGGTDDAGGGKGITEAQLNAFLAAIPAFLEWRKKGELPPDGSATPTLPLGGNTPAFHALFSQHAAKVDLFFDLCRLGAFDARTTSRLGGLDSHLQQLDPVDPAQVADYLAKLPIAAPAPGKGLPLADREINPSHRGWMREMRQKVLPCILGTAPGESLAEADWLRVKAAFAPYAAYLAQKKGAIVESIPPETLQAHLAPERRQEALRLLAADRQVATIVQQTQQLERLLLFHRRLLPLANNFVSFPDLYTPGKRALFEMGSAVMDGRCFAFAVKVENVAEHSAVAKQSNLFVLYLEVAGTAAEKFHVAVPITSGTKGNLAVGKRGVFIDIQGREYDAKIIQVIENPVSLREALSMPFRRLWNMFEGRIETWSSTAEKGLETEFGKVLAPPPVPAATTPAPPPTAPPNQAFMGAFFATAALGSAFAFITKTFSGMERHHVLMGLAAAAALVILPITLVAYLKLRRQDLSSLLEGCGWAINARMRLDRKQRRQFTRAFAYPPGAEGTPQHTRLKVLSAILVLELLAWPVLVWLKNRPVP